MRKAYLYVSWLAIAATVVFFASYFSGRRPSLDEEMERLRRPREPVPAKGQGIPSLRQPDPAPEPDASSPQIEPGVQQLGEGATVTREPVAEPGLVLVLDTQALAAAPAGVREELDRFLAHPPAGGRIGLRALAAPTAECGSVGSIRTPGPWSAEELRGALAAALASPAGPRDSVRALGEAERDLGEVPGSRAVVIVAGGGDGCGGDLCAASPDAAAAGTPVHVILVDGGAAGAGGVAAAGSGEAAGDPPWAAGYRCAADRSGGSLLRAAAAGDLERRLREVAQGIESAVTVRAFHGAGTEVQGTAPEGEAAWGVTIAAPGGGEEGAVRLSPSLPASFAVPAGTWVVRCRFRGIERVTAVAVAPGEHALVRVPFATGELYVEASDAAGGEIAGDSAGFGCPWGAAVLDAEGEELVAESCVLPARFELPEGEYQVRVKWKGREEALTGVTVERGGSALRTVDFSAAKP